MLISETVAIKSLQIEEGVKRFDFYRCLGCHRIFTLQDELRAFKRAEKNGDCRICPCGSLRYSPSSPVRTEWLGVLGYSIKVFLARAVAPLLERRIPATIPLLEWMCA